MGGTPSIHFRLGFPMKETIQLLGLLHVEFRDLRRRRALDERNRCDCPVWR